MRMISSGEPELTLIRYKIMTFTLVCDTIYKNYRQGYKVPERGYI
nr:MAG TPA: hypothetical protein [Caudoviricetes sp.]